MIPHSVAKRTMANQSSSKAKPNKRQLFAIGVLIAEICLIPIVPGLFIFARSLSGVLAAVGGDPNTMPSLWFLRDQYVFLTAKGVDASSIAFSFKLFGFMVWLSLPVVLLRLVSSPWLFGLVNWRGVLAARKLSVRKFFLGWLLVSSSIWASTQIRGADSVPLLGVLLRISPPGYICLEAFFFVLGLIAFAEGLLALLQLALKRDLNGASSQSQGVGNG